MERLARGLGDFTVQTPGVKRVINQPTRELAGDLVGAGDRPAKPGGMTQHFAGQVEGGAAHKRHFAPLGDHPAPLVDLLLQIALVYGHDIDDRARVKEIVAIIATSALTSGSSLLPHLVNLDPLYRAGLGGVSVVTANQLIGEAAIWYYGRKAKADIGLQRQGAQSAS